MGVIVKRNVALKAVVTPTMRAEVIAELDANVAELTSQMERFEIETRQQWLQMQNNDLARAMAFKKQLEEARAQQEENLNELKRRVEIASNWLDGQEVLRGAMEGFVEIEVGDHLPTVIGGVEIIALDDVVTEIRATNPMADDDPAAEGYHVEGEVASQDETGGDS